MALSLHIHLHIPILMQINIGGKCTINNISRQQPPSRTTHSQVDCPVLSLSCVINCSYILLKGRSEPTLSMKKKGRGCCKYSSSRKKNLALLEIERGKEITEIPGGITKRDLHEVTSLSSLSKDPTHPVIFRPNLALHWLALL